MISEKMYKIGAQKSIIRIMYDWGKERAREIGEENVFDFSLGNPNLDTPEVVSAAIKQLVNTEPSLAIHGYTNLQGDFQVREKISEHLNKIHGTNLGKEHIYMTAGATVSLRICFTAICNPGDEMIVIAPYFPEYLLAIEQAEASARIVPAKKDDFQIDFELLNQSITEKTKGVIINSPNNPTGAVYTEETILKLTQLLKSKQEEFNSSIYLISDEPYREISYKQESLPYILNYYENTMICYSFSKSLSLPGERIGYIVLSPDLQDFDHLYTAICGAARNLGQVNAPSLFQKVVASCLDAVSDINVYKTNRDIMYNALLSFGYECIKPEGAFYLFPKAMEEDAYAFCERAKQYNLVLIPGDDFGCPGYVRISYCVPTEVIKRALPAFEKLAKEYQK